MLRRLTLVARPRNAPGNRLPFALSAAVVLVTAAALALLVLDLAEPRAWVEIFIYVALIAVVVLNRPVRNVLGATSLAARTALAVFLLLLIAGQAIDRTNTTYPFAGWGMYSTPHEPWYFTYTAVFADGTEAPFPFHQVIPATDSRAFMAKLEGLLVLEASGQAVEPRIEEVLVILGRTYDRRADRGITHIRVARCAANIEPGPVAERLSCAEQRMVRIPPAPGSVL
jgi:hypothetical protein